MADAVTDQKAEALSLREQGMSANEVAESLDRPASTVRRWFSEAGDFDPDPPEDPPANGHVSAEEAARYAAAAGMAIQGQQTIDGGEVAASEPPPEEIIVRGTTPLDFFNAGGKLPNKASVRFTGGKVGLEQGTAFKKGDVIQFTGYATVVGTMPRDKRDKATGIVVECELRIEAEIDDLRVTA